MAERVVTEVPEALKTLIRYVMRGFYKIEEALVMDLLIHHPCIKEDDLCDLTKFDRKQLRGYLNTVKQDKFVKTRLRVETNAEGRTTRHNYYYICYSMFVNVIKYKLHSMQRKIENEERQASHRASFVCPNCQKQYTDLEVGQLMSGTGQLICYYCQTEVEEEASEAPKSTSRSLMVRFNEQMAPFFELLRELDGIKLSTEILEPQPKELKPARTSAATGSRAIGEKWSGDATRGTNFGPTQTEMTITMQGQGETAGPSKPKEAPVWMKESTVEGARSNSLAPSSQPSAAKPTASGAADDDDDIMRTLLSLENKSKTAAATHEESSNESEPEAEQRQTISQHGRDDFMESEDEDAATVPMVTIGGHSIPYEGVTPEMVETMTPQEKSEYIRVGQEMYQDMYD